MLGPTLDSDSPVSEVFQLTTENLHLRSSRNLDCSGTRGFHRQALPRDIRDVLHFDKRLAKQRQKHLRVCRQRAGRPEVEFARLSIENPFAGLVEFLEHIQVLNPLANAKAVLTIGRRRLHQSLFQIDGRNVFVRIGPVPRPVSVYPQIARVLPAPRPIPGILKAVFQLADLSAMPIFLRVFLRKSGDVIPLSFIRPAGDHHRHAVDEQFAMGCYSRTCEPA